MSTPLTYPSEEQISAAHELKLDRYSELQVECQENGWSCYNMAVEVGAFWLAFLDRVR